MVIIDERDPGGLVMRGKAGFDGCVLKLTLAEIAEQQQLVFKSDGEIVKPIAIVVADCAGNRAA